MPGHESVAIERGIIDDVDVGMTLTQLIDKYKGLLIGNKVYKKFGNKFPLLVKFIDSRQDLSVQVHPDDKLAMERHGCAGKTEMWYVIKGDVGSKIYAGLKESIKRERKANPTKGGIIAGLATFLTENAAFNTQNVQIANPERTVTFQIGDNSFELTLIQKRKPKN